MAWDGGAALAHGLESLDRRAVIRQPTELRLRNRRAALPHAHVVDGKPLRRRDERCKLWVVSQTTNLTASCSVGWNCRHDCDRGLAAFEFAAHYEIRKVQVRTAPLLL